MGQRAAAAAQERISIINGDRTCHKHCKASSPAAGSAARRRAAAQRPDQRRHLPHPRRPIDFDEAVTYARKTGIPALMQMNFQQRAARLKALALYLSRKEELYAISHLTGATRADSWVDIEGGTGTLFAYASMGSRELPSSNVLHEGPAMALGRTAASPAPTSWCRAAAGGAHQRLQLPDLGPAGKIRAELPGGHAVHRQAGQRHQLPDRSAGAHDARIRPAAGRRAATGDRQHRRSAGPPGRPTW
jgi:hypothetical protein